ncbi:MAG: phosphatase PAP2 family protein [Dokdonella sp.]
MSVGAILARPADKARYVGVQIIAVPVLIALAASALSVSGWDLRIQDLFFDPTINAFPWRRQPLLEGIGHDLLKMLPIGIGFVLLFAAMASPWVDALRRWQPMLWTTLVALCVGPGVITALKQVTAAHCPWDLARYGGYAPYTHDWFATSSAQAGRCFPSGHAGAGFSLVALSFAGWASGITRWRWAGLIIALSAGTVFSVVRTIQGAHFVSHSLWSAAIDWSCASLVFFPLLCLQRPFVSISARK